ncbi:MAG: hypothetical protein ACUVWP_01845 [bacterium]
MYPLCFLNWRIKIDISHLFYNWGLALNKIGDFESEDERYIEAVEKVKVLLKLDPN